MTRIKYNMVSENIYETINTFLGNGMFLKGVIDMNLMVMQIKEVSSGKVQYQGVVGSSLATAKRNMKMEMRLLGVQFLDEVRKKKEVSSTEQAA